MKVEAVTLEIFHATATLFHQIAEPRATRLDVAKTYAMAVRSPEATDWAAVNKAIIARWSVHALLFIKRLAHSGQCFGERP